MKRLTIVSILAIALGVLTGCSLLIKKPPVNLIEVTEIQDKIDSKESFILVVGNQAQCSTCESYLKGGLRKLDDNDGYKADYIMIDTIDKQKDMDMLSEIIYGELKEDSTQMIGVPTTYIIKDGVLAEKIQGPVVYEKIVEEYNKYIKN
mgnify:CR=1 FL=1